MGKNLVIVESPAKAKTINKILGASYIVKSSVGHVRDLPVKNLGVDIENAFEPQYTVMKGKKKVVDELKKAARSCDAIYLAPDPDREGEAIAWHLRELLDDGKGQHDFWRVQYNEITPAAVRKAFEHPAQMDMQRVDAQQARRILDRIVGYMVSPLLWRQIKRGLSAGRVQSVALRILCERERQIEVFVPEEYWLLGAKVRKRQAPLDPFAIRLVRVNGKKPLLGSGDQAAATLRDLENAALRVADITTTTVHKSPYPPFITSSLQQAASTVFGFSPQRTMSLAQKLYEGVDLESGPTGLITYMRTDSFAISHEAVAECRKLIVDRFGAEYCPEKPRAYRNKSSAQGAHEAIRPTGVLRTPESLRGRLDASELKLYDLIWRRFVASQMSSAEIDQKGIAIDARCAASANEYRFHAASSEIKFPGYMKVTGAEERKRAQDEEQALPPLTRDEPLDCLEWLKERKETQPPRRYSEAALIRALEGNGVGRPSTYAQIVSTLQNREYALKENRILRPTALGRQVNDLLVHALSELFDVKFTATMEASLDRIEHGEIGRVEMLNAFYGQFSQWLEAAKPPTADADVVRRVLAALKNVKEWYPEQKVGKRTYGDKKFTDSVASQLEEGEKPVSARQMDALLRIAARYRAQSDTIRTLLTDIGRADLMDDPSVQPPREISERKFKLLEPLELGESAAKFVKSLHSQIQRGRRLSEAQVKALDNILLAHADMIPDFEKRAANLELDTASHVVDHESGPLLEAMKHVQEWNPPVKRGKREFDDQKFYLSLRGQFESRRALSERQRAALKKMMGRYKNQIPSSAAEPAAEASSATSADHADS
jgi:DNA topoisomerase I